MLDTIGKDHLRLDSLLTFAVDEADELFSKGLRDQMYKTSSRLAAVVPAVFDVTTHFISDSVRILHEKKKS